MNEKDILKQFQEIFEDMGPRGGIVLWQDLDGEFADFVADLAADDSLHGVEILCEEPGKEFMLKSRLNVLPMGSKALLYRTQVPLSPVDWLEDVKARAIDFSADYASSLLRNLNAPDEPGIRLALGSCKRFFSKKRNVGKLKALRDSYDTAEQLLMGALAVSLGADSPTAASVVVAALRAGAKVWACVEQDGLGEGFASLVLDCCGFDGDAVSGELPRHILRAAAASTFPERDLPGCFSLCASDVQGRFCHEVFSLWLREDREGLLTACRAVEERADIEIALRDVATDSLLWCDVFPCVDAVLLRRLFLELASPVCDPNRIISAVRMRADLAWGDEFDACYRALNAGARLRAMSTAADLLDDGVDAAQIWKGYAFGGYKIDSWYRLFRVAVDEIAASASYGLDASVADAAVAVENLYKEGFLRRQNAQWCSSIEADLANAGEVRGVARQVDFYSSEVEGLANRSKRAWVIVSDALRYEVAAELADELEKSTRGVVCLKALQAALPTKTKVGMPALLPHGTFSACTKRHGGFTMLVDGAEAVTSTLREGVLRRYSPGAIAVRYDDFVYGCDREDRRDLVEAAQVVYIYHNTIDAIGDSAQTERKVLKACSDTVQELRDLIKLIVREFRASEILVTSDHGFLYTAKPIEESEHVGVDAVCGEVAEASRRYAVARSGANSEYLMRAKLPGEEGLVAFFPRECIRLRAPGSGENYVHGGVSLQEMCIPVLEFRNFRSGSKGFIETTETGLELVTSIGALSNPSFAVELLQSRPAGGKVLPTEYDVYVADAAGRAVTGVARVNANSDREDASDRVYRARLSFLPSVRIDDGAAYSLVARSARSRNVEVLSELLVHPDSFAARSPWLS